MTTPRDENALAELKSLFDAHKERSLPRTVGVPAAFHEEIQDLRSDLIVFDAQVVAGVLDALEGRPVHVDTLHRFPQFDERILTLVAGNPPESCTRVLNAFATYKRGLDTLLDAVEKAAIKS